MSSFGRSGAERPDFDNAYSKLKKGDIICKAVLGWIYKAKTLTRLYPSHYWVAWEDKGRRDINLRD